MHPRSSHLDIAGNIRLVDGLEVVLKIHGQICKLYGLNKQIDIKVQADQMNIQNNVQTNLTLRFDPKTLTDLIPT